MNTFNVGDKVQKIKGYRFDGVVVSAFKTTSGEQRYVVECSITNSPILHIYNGSQLALDTRSLDDILNEMLETIKTLNNLNR